MRQLFKYENQDMMLKSMTVHAAPDGTLEFNIRGLCGHGSVRLGRNVSKDLADALTDELLENEDEHDLEGRFPIDPDC